jgi:hypothetical protein
MYISRHPLSSLPTFIGIPQILLISRVKIPSQSLVGTLLYLSLDCCPTRSYLQMLALILIRCWQAVKEIHQWHHQAQRQISITGISVAPGSVGEKESELLLLLRYPLPVLQFPFSSHQSFVSLLLYKLSHMKIERTSQSPYGTTSETCT